MISHANTVGQRMITFATFHVNVKATQSSGLTQLRKGLDSNIFDYESMIKMFFTSAKHFHPECKQVIITDQQSTFTQLPEDINFYRIELDTNQLMLSRLMAQIEFLKQCPLDQDVVLIDSDILILGNLDPIFEQEFDIAFTCLDPENKKRLKTSSEHAINGGVIFIHHTQRVRAIAFLEKVYICYQDKYMSYAAWLGDQCALLSTVGAQRFYSRTSARLYAENTQILLFDFDVYNFSPKKHISSFLSRGNNALIIHFRGKRKEFMPLYWRWYLSRQIPDHTIHYSWFFAIKTILPLLPEFIIKESEDRFKRSVRPILGKK